MFCMLMFERYALFCFIFFTLEKGRPWAGAKCQYQDISPQFQILFWTSFALLVTLLWVVSLLANISSSASGHESVPPHSKTD